jgi:hypothetical protein
MCVGIVVRASQFEPLIVFESSTASPPGIESAARAVRFHTLQRSTQDSLVASA